MVSGSLSDRIDEAFRAFCEFMKLPHWRALYFGENRRDGLIQMSSSHEVTTDQKQPLTVEKIPELWKKLQRGEFVNFFPSSELELEFQLLAREVRFLGDLSSTFVIPLLDNQQTLGLVLFGLDSARDVADGLRDDRLRLFSDLIAQYLARAKATQAIAQGRYEARRLTGKLLTAQEDERKRISREIHDDICQRLAAAGMQVDTIEKQMRDDKSPFSSLDQLKGSLVSIFADVQRISRELHPKILDELGLVDAIRSECHRLAESGYLQVNFRCHGLPDQIDRASALCLFRIVQESLWNVVKHAGVQQAKIVLQADPEALSMPKLNGLQAMKQLLDLECRAKFVVLTMHADPIYAARAISSGATAYVLKHAAVTELITAVQEALAGRTYVAPELAGQVTDLLHAGAEEFDLEQRLTPRQLEVLQLFTDGHSAKEVAKILCISKRTAENHKASIKRLLNAPSTAELIKLAIRLGLVNSQ